MVQLSFDNFRVCISFVQNIQFGSSPINLTPDSDWGQPTRGTSESWTCCLPHQAPQSLPRAEQCTNTAEGLGLWPCPGIHGGQCHLLELAGRPLVLALLFYYIRVGYQSEHCGGRVTRCCILGFLPLLKRGTPGSPACSSACFTFLPGEGGWRPQSILLGF